MIGKEQLELMKRTAILVNISRGGVVDQEALCKALKSGQLRGAGLDVFCEEPIRRDDPLLTLTNIVTTPHIGAGVLQEKLKKDFKAAFKNVARMARGLTPFNLIV